MEILIWRFLPCENRSAEDEADEGGNDARQPELNGASVKYGRHNVKTTPDLPRASAG